MNLLAGLQGKHVAITGARKGEEISKLIENLGGIPYVRPTQGMVFLDETQVSPDLDRLLTEGADWLILTTGIGTQTMLDVAERLGRKEQLLRVLQNIKIASRGYKTRNVLKELGIEPDVQDDDGTVRGLIRMLEPHSLKGKRVALQLYGEMPHSLLDWLKRQEAKYFEILPYKHVPPAEEEMRSFITELLEEKYDAVAFTSAIQVQYLFQAAEQFAKRDQLLQVFAGRTLPVAVGIVTAEALEEAGVKRHIQPKNQRMGGMVVEMNRYFTEQNG